jgi:hypothetical protein
MIAIRYKDDPEPKKTNYVPNNGIHGADLFEDKELKDN